MDSEEFEQIPWSGLVAQAQPSVDPKWYIAGGVVGAIVIVLLVMQMFSSSAAPDVAPTLALDPPPEPVPSTAVVEPATGVVEGAVTEADLMAIDPADAVHDGVDVVRLVAEWFVTDYFTRDGSAETLASVEAMLGTDVGAVDLPHHGGEGTDTFVEWARAFAFEYSQDDLAGVSVAFRTVHRGDDGFVRDPVRAVIVEIADWKTDPTVTGIPIDTDLP